jgi:hypothetical protein
MQTMLFRHRPNVSQAKLNKLHKTPRKPASQLEQMRQAADQAHHPKSKQDGAVTGGLISRAPTGTNNKPQA